MKTIRLQISYDGTHYHGWQVQPNGISIQGTLQERIAQIAQEQVSVLAAGRTDAGVHALGQVASFRTVSHHSPDVFLRALNATLPADISILAAAYAPDSFHPRFDATSKIYTYLIANESRVSPFAVRYAAHIKSSLDTFAMDQAAQYILGTHDFTSFRASGCGAKTAIRTVYACSVEELNEIGFLGFTLTGRFICITIEADAFVRHMVRTIAGTLIEVGLGKRKADAMADLLLRKNRSLAGPTAPACGLFLTDVFYESCKGSNLSISSRIS